MTPPLRRLLLLLTSLAMLYDSGYGTAPMRLEVLQYNVFGRPSEVSSDGQADRLARIPASLARLSSAIDVVTFAEADVKGQRDQMLAQFRARGFNFSTSVLHDPDPFTSALNGGVLVVSRWPIVREAQHVYRNACHYSDCLAAKGVKYARVLKTVDKVSKIFNVFATHMQAWSTEQGRADRILQAQQMRAFVDAMEIPHHEPLIFAGDFNVDNHSYAAEVANLVKLLKATSPVPVGSQQFTSDPQTNLLVGRDGAANSNKCSSQYVQSWGIPKNNTFYPNLLTRVPCTVHRPHGWVDDSVYISPDNMCYCPCCPLEWLDYVLYGNAPYQQPIGKPTLQAFVNQVGHFSVDWTAAESNMKMELIDLSDHYPVLARFEFPVKIAPGKDNDPSTFHLDGCSTDADCRFHNFHCYCSGDDCYYKGKHVNGMDYSPTHEVNRNCLYQKTSFRCLCGPT